MDLAATKLGDSSSKVGANAGLKVRKPTARSGVLMAKLLGFNFFSA